MVYIGDDVLHACCLSDVLEIGVAKSNNSICYRDPRHYRYKKEVSKGNDASRILRRLKHKRVTKKRCQAPTQTLPRVGLATKALKS